MEGKTDYLAGEKQILDFNIQPGFLQKFPLQACLHSFPKLKAPTRRCPKIPRGNARMVRHHQLFVFYAEPTNPNAQFISKSLVNGTGHFFVDKGV